MGRREPAQVISQRPHRTARLTALDINVLARYDRPCKALSQGFDFAHALATFDDKGFAQRAAAKGWVPKVLVP